MTTSEFLPQHLDAHYVVMESSPVTWRYAGDENEQVPEWDPHIHLKIRTAVVTKGLFIPDEGECDLCTDPIGYVLNDDDDDPRGNGVSWHWATAVYYGRHADILLLCEECSPHSIRDLFEERAKPNLRSV